MAIKFCVKAGKSAVETIELINKAYGSTAMSRAIVYRWYARFRDGREDVKDDARSGRPSTARTEENVESVRRLLTEDRRTTLQMIADRLNIGKETVRRIVTEDLGKRKICARFVPHALTTEQKQERVVYCQDLLLMGQDELFWEIIITGDETWCFAYDPATKRQSAEWVGQNSPKPKKLRFQKSRVKTMLIVFLDAEGVIHREFVPEGQKVNAEFYVGVLDRLLKRIRRVRTAKFQSSEWFLLHDNAPSHNAAIVKKFLANRNVAVLHHPPYSPDLAPADYFLFPKLKFSLKGRHFQTVEEIQCAVTRELNNISKTAFLEGMKKLKERANKCIDQGGMYFEE